jgi:acid phosphatase (class A)
MKLGLLVATCSFALASNAFPQQLEHTPRPADEHPQGYLSGAEIRFRQYLAPPPPEGSLEDTLDATVVKELQEVTPERWARAEADEAYVYPEFEVVFGSSIDRERSPHLVHLLNEAMHDVAIPIFAGKDFFRRRRPYQRWQLPHVCGERVAPAPEPAPEDRSSYPSGHSAYGWATALILAEVAPDRAEQVLARGEDYGVSRVICGMHFPSDVAAGRQVASAVVARLNATPDFERDLAAARTEHQLAARKIEP